MRGVLVAVLMSGCAWWHKPAEAPPQGPRLAVHALEPMTVRIVISWADSLNHGRQRPAVAVGEHLVLGAMLATEHGTITCQPVWRSLQPDIATVDHDGRVRGKRPGSVTIAVHCGGIGGGLTVDVGPRP